MRAKCGSSSSKDAGDHRVRPVANGRRRGGGEMRRYKKTIVAIQIDLLAAKNFYAPRRLVDSLRSIDLMTFFNYPYELFLVTAHYELFL